MNNIAKDGEKKANKRNQCVANDLGEDPFTTCVKRMFAETNLLVMCVNTLSSVFSISASVSLIPYQNSLYMVGFCDYGDASDNNMFVQCPYIPSPEFQTIVSLWCAYFAFYFTWRYYWTSIYETNDLRYYIYYDKFNHTFVNRIMISVGVVLTFVSGFYGIATVVKNGTTASIISILLFICVNLFNLYQLATCRFSVLTAINMEKEEAFLKPIVINTEPMWSVLNLNGLLLSHFTLFEHISNALSACFLMNDVSHVSKVGNVDQLKSAMRTLNPLKQ